MTDPMEARLRALLDARAQVTDAEVARLAEVLDSMPARRRRRAPAWLAAAAVLAVVAVAAVFGVASLLGTVRLGPVARPSVPPVTQASPSQPAASPAPDPTSSLDTSVPAWAADLRGQLECTDASGARSQERGDGDPVGRTGTASPYPWLESLDAIDLPMTGFANLPESGWESGESGFARYEYRADGRVRAVILMEGRSTQGGPGSWAVTAFASCAPDEFDPADGRTTDDLPLVDANAKQPADVTIFGGPAHCDWQSAIFLHVAGQLYLRDPIGVLSSVVRRPWRTLAALPATAIDSGLSSARWHLYTGPDAVVWMVAADATVEEWPRATEDVGCA